MCLINWFVVCLLIVLFGLDSFNFGCLCLVWLCLGLSLDACFVVLFALVSVRLNGCVLCLVLDVVVVCWFCLFVGLL